MNFFFLNFEARSIPCANWTKDNVQRTVWRYFGLFTFLIIHNSIRFFRSSLLYSFKIRNKKWKIRVNWYSRFSFHWMLWRQRCCPSPCKLSIYQMKNIKQNSWNEFRFIEIWLIERILITKHSVSSSQSNHNILSHWKILHNNHQVIMVEYNNLF